MFPFALLDMITHFGMTDAEFRTEFSRNPHAERSKALTEYWNHRAAIKKICDPHFAANPIRFKEAVARGAHLLPAGGDDSHEALRAQG